MEEVESVERMRLVLDASIHVDAAAGAGIALDWSFLVHDLQLVAVGRDRKLVAAGDADDREQRSLRLPALCAAARVVERHVRSDTHAHRVAGAFAGERAAGEARRALPYSVIQHRVNLDCHRSPASPLGCLYATSRIPLRNSFGPLHVRPEVVGVPP